MQKQSPEVFCKKNVFRKVLQTSQENTCVGDFFKQSCRSSVCKLFRKRIREVCETFKNNYFEKHQQTTASGGGL